MAKDRLVLQTWLEEAVKPYDGHVYFQPPSVMEFPAIRYKKAKIQNEFADNLVYSQKQYYDLTVIEKNPEKPLTGLISKFPGIQWVTGFVKDNLYHEQFTLYY